MSEKLLYLQEKQINELFKINPPKIGDYFKGTAYSYDSNSVFHGYTKKITNKSSSISYICYFLFIDESITDIDESSLIANFRHNQKEKVYVLVILQISKDKLNHKASFINNLKSEPLSIHFVPKDGDLYSRAKGLIETDILRDKKVGIVGLGSGGSQIAIELAKAGVGNFIFYDFDRLELSNISRHICGIDDIGRYKTFSVRDLIYNKNPNANVVTYEININSELELFRNTVKDVNLIICASDTTRSRFNVNQISISNNIVTLFGRAITRAAGGDILRVIPNVGPCLNCLFGQGVIGKEEEEYSQQRQINEELPAYTTADEINNIIQVGLSSDIAPISLMIVKLAIVELSKGKESGISSLEEDLIANFYIWANRREKIYANWPKMEYNFTKQTILRWYGAKVKKDENCFVCGSKLSDNPSTNIFK